MSRATTIVPVSESRVLIGCAESVRRMSGIGRLRSTRTACSPKCVVRGFGQVFRRIALQLFEERALGRDLGEDLAVGAARDADADGQARAVARQADHAHVVAEILAAELRADAAARVSSSTACSISRSRNAWPARLPEVGKVSSQRVEASFTVLSVNSAEVPPMTIAR